MEYLMTYGWAILIIAVVLGALFSLGIFSGGQISGITCVASPGFLCQNPVLGTNGNLSFSLGQSTGATIYNVGLACVATTLNPSGLPNPSTSMVYVSTNGAANSVLANSYNSAQTWEAGLTNGQTLSVSALKCFGSNANALASPALGTTFSGGIWMNYTASSGANQIILTQKIASVSLKVV